MTYEEAYKTEIEALQKVGLAQIHKQLISIANNIADLDSSNPSLTRKQWQRIDKIYAALKVMGVD